MEQGQLNFRMVRLAREKLELTQTAVARRTGIHQARLSRLESGQHVTVSPQEADALACALEVSLSFLEQEATPAAAPLFRKRAIRSAKRVAAIQARLNFAVLIAQRLLAAGVDLDAPQRFPEPGDFAPDEPGAAAMALRRDWRLPAGPVDDLTEVIESAAGLVLHVDFGTSDATAAFIATRNDGRLWFLINTRETAGDRVRLSLAHELGHAVLHRLIPSVDEAEVESQAFRFAAALLLPPDSFDRSVPFDALTLQHARALKRTYGVSMQAIIRAAHDRKRISRARYTSLYKQLSARQWRTEEPDPIAIEQPQLWPDVLRVHREEHDYDDRDLAVFAHVTPEILNELFPTLFEPPRPRLRSVVSAR
ncbi:MAG TPA: XRE family transcriptional regulator [Conexibacter sp.]|jgi:Zn-dependent peptidase ImmA (M78 family)/transcriptional regulator with XRE-family HTH domain